VKNLEHNVKELEITLQKEKETTQITVGELHSAKNSIIELNNTKNTSDEVNKKLEELLLAVKQESKSNGDKAEQFETQIIILKEELEKK